MDNRIKHLDGLRGLAIIWVVLFHAFSRWGKIETFNQSELVVELFSFGWLGVQLFFAVSGYVIYMSLFKSQNFIMFGLARYLRLAPAMIIASILLYLTSFYIVERPLGVANLQDLLPSLTFVEPGLISKISGWEVGSLDGAFWSLYVEVKFYVIVAVLFYLVRDRNLSGLVAIYFFWLLSTYLVKVIGIENEILMMLKKIVSHFGTRHYGWFLIGVWAYKYHTEPTAKNFSGVLLFSLIAVAVEGRIHGFYLASLVTASLFIIPLVSIRFQSVLSSPILIFMGFISYPLYLLHQNIVTGLAIKLHGFYPELASPLYPIPFIILVIVGAYLLAKLEPKIRHILKSIVPETCFGVRLHREKPSTATLAK